MLIAEGPHHDVAEELMLFGQFVGAWSIENTYYDEAGNTESFAAQWHFGWILEGRAIQDVLRHRAPGSGEVRAGTTIRFYDAAIDAWRVIWVAPASGRLYTLIARKVDDEIVLEGSEVDGRPMRWSFSEITPDSFRWRGVISDDGGETWRLEQEMHARRV